MSHCLPSVTLSGRGAEVESSPVLTGEEVPESLTDEDVPWVVLVWNDPINLMSYVVFVLQKLFGYSTEKATQLMLDVHERVVPLCLMGAEKKLS